MIRRTWNVLLLSLRTLRRTEEMQGERIETLIPSALRNALKKSWRQQRTSKKLPPGRWDVVCSPRLREE
jgi:hypothetical protein